MKRTYFWAALGAVAVVAAVAFCLDGDYADRELRRALRCIRGGRA